MGGAELRFNEAAGFTRRKLMLHGRWKKVQYRGASMRPPDLPGRKHIQGASIKASMRPPDLPGGNSCRGTALLLV